MEGLNMRSLIGLPLVFVCALSVVSSLLIPLDRMAAQERKGGISGHVTDNSGSVLQGARIELQPVGTIVASNIQGEFIINDVTPGTFTVSITYVGFNQFTKQATVAAGQIATVDAKLEVESSAIIWDLACPPSKSAASSATPISSPTPSRTTFPPAGRERLSCCRSSPTS